MPLTSPATGWTIWLPISSDFTSYRSCTKADSNWNNNRVHQNVSFHSMTKGVIHLVRTQNFPKRFCVRTKWMTPKLNLKKVNNEGKRRQTKQYDFDFLLLALRINQTKQNEKVYISFVSLIVRYACHHFKRQPHKMVKHTQVGFSF